MQQAATTLTLTALRAINNRALAGEKLPSRLKLLEGGPNVSIYGTYTVDPQSAAAFVTQQRSIGRERVPIDFEHNTVPGTAEYGRTQEPREVAGYGTPKILSDGLYLEDITWTPAGEAKARNYEDLSPAPFADAKNNVIALHSVALTRAGAVTDLHFFSADAATHLQPLLKALSANTQPATRNMETLTVTELSTALGVEATKPAVLARLTALSALCLALPLKDGKLVGLAAPNDPGLNLLENRLKAIEAGQESRERSDLLAQATREGKVIPLSAEEITAAPLATLRAMITKLPAGVVPLSARSGQVRETTGNPDKGAQQKAAIAKYRASANCDFDTAFNAVRAAEPALFV